MAEFNAESIDWLNQIESLRAQPASAKRSVLKEALKASDSQISNLQNVEFCFDPPAMEKVRLAAQDNPPFIFSLRNALALSKLIPRQRGSKRKELKTDLTVFHAALDLALSRRLATAQIEALVEWMLKGHSPETFKESETGKKGKSVRPASDEATTPDDLKPVFELFKKAEAEIARNDGQTTYQDELRTLLAKGTAETEEDEDSGKKTKAGKKSKSSSGSQTDWFWEMLLGVKFVSQLRSRAKKGELTTTDKVLILLYFVVAKPFELLFKFLGKLFKGMAKDFGHWLKHTLGKTFSQIIQWAIPLLIICAVIWGAGKVYQYAIVNPLHWVEAKVKSGFHGGGSSPESTFPSSTLSTSSTTPPLSQPVGSSKLESAKLKPKTSNSELTTTHSNVVSYQPSMAFNTSASPSDSTSWATLYNSKLLEQEIAALPRNCIVKSFPVLTDEGMPGDLAVSRIQSVTDPDKYTLVIDGDKKIILNITTTATNLIINYKSADPLKFLDGGGKLNHFWEDLLYIHTDEIEVENKTPYHFFQLSLVVSGAKHAMTIQCASADDLKHLVSALQYFIRNSRLGHDTALAGMPYPSQGVVLNNHWVEKLWAESPMDKAGVKLNDLIWSLEKDTQSPQDDNKLKAQLDALASGPHPLYIYSPAASENIGIEQNEFHTGNFSPKRRKVFLGQ